MLQDDLAQYLWTLTGSHRLAGFSGATLLAVLACNLNKHTPTRAEIARHCAHSPRATYDALQYLTQPGGPVLERDGRFALQRFAHFFPKRDALPGSAVSVPPQSKDAETQHDDGQPQTDGEPAQAARENAPAFRTAPPRAEKAVSSSEVNGGNGALKAPLAGSVDFIILRALCDFAEHVCKMNSAAAAVEHAAEHYGVNAAIAALEQYHYAYTRRNREAGNPPGQLLTWCKHPEKMDRLPEHALRFAAWQQRRLALQTPQAPAPPTPQYVSMPTRELMDKRLREKKLTQNDKVDDAKAAPEAAPSDPNKPVRQS